MRGREDSPWYPTLRLFRQAESDVWAGVFGAMANALRPMLASETLSRVVGLSATG